MLVLNKKVFATWGVIRKFWKAFSDLDLVWIVFSVAATFRSVSGTSVMHSVGCWRSSSVFFVLITWGSTSFEASSQKASVTVIASSFSGSSWAYNSFSFQSICFSSRVSWMRPSTFADDCWLLVCVYIHLQKKPASSALASGAGG